MSRFLNRLMKGRPKESANASSDDPSRQDNALALTHLKKIFADFRHPSASANAQSQEEKLYCMVPLFNRVFANATPAEMMDRFSDVLQFSSHTAKLMVSEIKKRAMNLSTDEACLAIVRFLEIGHTQNPSNGWQLFLAVDTLAAGPDSIIDCMSASFLPSTLVKCLYLFFDLPAVETGQGTGDLTPAESRLLLQKTFVQVLVRVCSHLTPAEELANSNDLQLLFSAISSPCPAYNHMWRKSAAEVLMTLSRHGLSSKVVQYIHDKRCVSECVTNMQTNIELSPLEIVEMFVTVFCFLKDSSEVSQVLLEDFRSCDGYIFLIQFLLRLEEDSREETVQALRNLVLLVGSLTTCGHEEITPVYDANSMFKLDGFTIPKPLGKGISVRNIQAFKVLQTVFIKSRTCHLCMIILEVISSLFHQDNANYFILEPQSTLPEFAEGLHSKPPDVQSKYFELIEFIVTNLNFVPCKELNGMSLLLKANRNLDCSLLCMKTLIRILDHSALYKRVFSEVGLLEVLITCLHRFASSVKEIKANREIRGVSGYSLLTECNAVSLLDSVCVVEVTRSWAGLLSLVTDCIVEGDVMDGKERDLGFMVMNALAVLLSGRGGSSADVFRQCGGARCAHNLVPYEFCRRQALSLVKQLLLSNSGDDDMGTLLCLMQKEPPENMQIKISVLKVIMSAMTESHRARSMFRKVDGFRYIMSILVSMDGCLGGNTKPPWNSLDKKLILTLLQAIFSTLTVAMRYEPANVKFFKVEVQYFSLLSAIRLLGCFTEKSALGEVDADLVPCFDPVFKGCFTSASPLRTFCSHVPESVAVELLDCCFIFRCLYDMGVDHYDSRESEDEKPAFFRRMTSMFSGGSEGGNQSFLRSSWNGNSNSSSKSTHNDFYDHAIVHAGAVSAILKLIPAVIQSHVSQALAVNLQTHMMHVLRSLLNSERNQQIMCTEGFVRDLFTYCNIALIDETHTLHQPVQYMFESMAAQSLKPNDLRDYLRLGNPLCCKALDELINGEDSESTPSEGGTSSGGPIPVNRVRCIVSMTTPRDVNLHGLAITPPFVELDMNYEGYGCLYIPSIAPQGPPNPSVVGVTGSTDVSIFGGIGTGERVFPPSSGLTYSTWICIEKYSADNPHPLYLLQIVRKLTDQSDYVICLSIHLDCRDKAIIISTQEKTMTSTGSEGDVAAFTDSKVRVWCPQMILEGSWQHITLVFAKSGMLKTSSVALYLNGTYLSTHKLHYISPNIGVSAGSAQSATSVFGYIGTPAQMRRPISCLVWKQGPCILIEEALAANNVEKMYTLGPNYVGCLQAVPQGVDGGTVALTSEDKVMFALHADASSVMTVARIKKVYNKFDGKSVANQLSTASQENTTPVRVLYNSASHLSGAARSLGAVLLGHTGVHMFHPQPVATVLNDIGGMSILLGFVAMANDVEGLYAAVKALVCVIKSTSVAHHDMQRINGYQLLSMLYKKKQALLNSHILHLTFSLIGTIDSNKEITIIPNRVAFEDLLCDLEVWHDAPSDLQRSLYEHFYELLTETTGCEINKQIMREARLVKKILYVMRDSQLSKATLDILCRVLKVLLYNNTDSKDILRFGQFVVSTLPELFLTEADQLVTESYSVTGDSSSGVASSHSIRLRNSCLGIVKSVLQFSTSSNREDEKLDVWLADTLLPVLGYDWVMLFMQRHLHKSTVVLTAEILLSILSIPEHRGRFREGTLSGGWLNNSQQVLDDRVLHGVNIETGNSQASVREVNTAICKIPGFVSLQWLMESHCDIAELYYLLGCLVTNEQVTLPLHNVQLQLESLCSHFLRNPTSETKKQQQSKKGIVWNQEPAVIILIMVKAMMNMQWQNEEEGSWMREYPITLIQLLLLMYQRHQAMFRPIAMSSDFLLALASTLFQQRSSTAASSERSTPVHGVVSSSPGPCQGDGASFMMENSLDNSGLEERATSLLTDHPAKRIVIDLIMKIILDSFSMAPSRNTQVVEIILDTCPPHCGKREQAEFQTAILHLIMDHLLAADILLGEQAAVQLHSGSSGGGTASFSHIVAHVFFFTNLVVDKLWHGSYNKEAKDIFEFIKELIAQGKRRSSSLSLDILYACLNRTILFELSRKTDNIAKRSSVLESLHRLTVNRSLVFGPGNYDLEFISCLTHCLLELTSARHQVACDDGGNTQWHIDSANISGEEESTQLLVTAATRVWQELYVHKKPAIEEALKVSLSFSSEVNPSPKITTPDLDSLRGKLSEQAAKCWTIFFENQKKSSVRDVERFHTQVQSRLERMGSGVLRFATGRKLVRELPAMKQTSISVEEYRKWLSTHTCIVRDLVDYQMTIYELDNNHMHEFIHEGWLRTERELLRERGIWGPPQGSSLDKYQLDMTEGPLRMKIKMERNDEFYQHYPFRALSDVRPTKYKSPVSRDSETFHRSRRVESLIEEETPQKSMVDTSTDSSIDMEREELSNAANSLLKAPSLLPRNSMVNSQSETFDEEDTLDGDVTSTSTDDINQSDAGTASQSETNLEESVKTSLDNHQTLTRLLDEGEKIGPMFRCARIQGLESFEGIILLGKDRYYILDGFTLLSTNQIQDIDSIAEEYRDPIIPKVQYYTSPSSAAAAVSTTRKMCLKFYYDDIREVLKRRYLLQPIALELFNTDGRNVLLAFPPKMRNKVLTKLIAAAPSLTNQSLLSVAGQKQSTKMEQGSGIISSLISERSVTTRWERGEISNFQYLMNLNTLAGRSYNDLMQYPVFPWILADYTSDQLDLENPETFRDLSKPMGALTPGRLAQFQKRYKEWDDPTGETPAYHYGTHYSCAMIVASYLVRMEPFTQHFLTLQGGHFDLADRMFHTIKEAYDSASKTNMADVKELIPEFFYLPDFLMNANKFELGEKQSGVRLNHVGLPPWAKGDAREFVRVHREALECDYVSAHLHEWIDLIFGYKQQGKPAVEASNVFHYLFYEGNVDIYSIDDPLKRNAIIGFINNFGQIPKQLFKRAHPQKKLKRADFASSSGPNPVVPSANQYAINSDRFFFSNPECLNPNMSPIKELHEVVGQIIQTERLAVLAVEQNMILLPPSYSRYLAWGFSDHSLRICNYDSERALVVFENLESSSIICACSPNARTIITAGSSTVVNVWKLSESRGRCTAKLKQPLYGHTAPVLCLAVSSAFNILVSGSCDKTCIIWDLSRLRYVTQLSEHNAPVAAISINDLTGVIATCASSWLHLWTVNGEPLASVDTAGNGTGPLQINCVAMSQANDWDGNNVILTGGSDGVVRMFTVELVKHHKSVELASEQLLGNEKFVALSKSLDQTDVRSSTPLSPMKSLDSTSAVPEDYVDLTSDSLTRQQTSEVSPTRPVPATRRSLSVQSVDLVKSSVPVPVPARRTNISSTEKWRRQLIFRSKLTMHTAYERKDNKDPSSVTAITCSRDHRSVFVGDTRGRVLLWSMSDVNGPADHWVKDEDQDSCTQCDSKFTTTNRRHHCRNCGQLFCARCSKHEADIPQMNIHKPVRVCMICYNTLKSTTVNTFSSHKAF